MRVLVTWGSKRGGTRGIAERIGEMLWELGHEVTLLPADKALKVEGFDAAVIGGALYANRWHPDARRFVNRRVAVLRRVPVWLFSSGPLDDSAAREALPPTREVEILMERVGAQGHRTFGGRLAADAKGFPASAMARTHAGDWRDAGQIRAWAADVAHALATARPLTPVEHRGRSIPRLLLHGTVGWALCAAAMFALLATAPGAAIAVHALFAPAVFVLVARHYFRARGAREPLPTALAFTGLVAALDGAVVAGAVQRSPALFASFTGFWLPLALLFLATWVTGGIMATLPWPKLPHQPTQPHPPTLAGAHGA